MHSLPKEIVYLGHGRLKGGVEALANCQEENLGPTEDEIFVPKFGHEFS